jgi:hypothetical protein
VNLGFLILAITAVFPFLYYKLLFLIYWWDRSGDFLGKSELREQLLFLESEFITLIYAISAII